LFIEILLEGFCLKDLGFLKIDSSLRIGICNQRGDVISCVPTIEIWQKSGATLHHL